MKKLSFLFLLIGLSAFAQTNTNIIPGVRIGYPPTNEVVISYGGMYYPTVTGSNTTNWVLMSGAGTNGPGEPEFKELDFTNIVGTLEVGYDHVTNGISMIVTNFNDDLDKTNCLYFTNGILFWITNIDDWVAWP